MQPFKALLAGDLHQVAATGEQGALQLLGATHAGMTTDEFEGLVRDWLTHARHSPTRLSFQRTRMSADRTLMSVMRTALSLIGFGFTIYQVFRYLRESVGVDETGVRPEAARNFGVALVVVGVVLLVLGTIGHVRFMLELRTDHGQLEHAGLIPHDHFPYSVTLAVSLLLLLTNQLTEGGRDGDPGPAAQ